MSDCSLVSGASFFLWSCSLKDIGFEKKIKFALLRLFDNPLLKCPILKTISNMP